MKPTWQYRVSLVLAFVAIGLLALQNDTLNRRLTEQEEKNASTIIDKNAERQTQQDHLKQRDSLPEDKWRLAEWEAAFPHLVPYIEWRRDGTGIARTRE